MKRSLVLIFIFIFIVLLLYVYFFFINNPTIPKCSDGTVYGECSSNKPLYCENGSLIDKCSVCNCFTDFECLANERCNPTTTADYFIIGSDESYTAKNSSGQTIQTGSDAATLINSVLNMTKAGEKVAFQGSFSLLSMIRPKSNTTLLFGTSRFTVDAAVSNLVTLSSGATGITFDGGFFDAKGNCNFFINGYGYSSLTFQNGDFQGFTTDVIILTHAPGGSQGNHLIQYNNFHGAVGGNSAYVTFNNAANSKILHNTFDGPSGGDHAIGVFSPSTGYNEIAYNTMVGSTGHEIYTTTPNMFIHDNELGAGSGDGCVVKAKSFIYNNYIHDRGAWAITLYWWETGTSEGDLAGSRIYNNTIENTLDALVIRPSRHMEPELDVTITDVEYTNNTISGGTGAGFRFIEIGYNVANVTFQCNKVSNKPYGARIDNSSSLIDGIKFLGNTFISVPTPFSVGAGTSDMTIAYNDLTNADATKLLMDLGVNTMVYDNLGLEDKNVPAVKIPEPSQC